MMTLTEALIFNTEQNRFLGKWRRNHPPRLKLRPTDCPSHCLPLSLRSFPLPIIPLYLLTAKKKLLKRKTGDEW